MISFLTRWADAHRAEALDLVRIYLGLGLLTRGIVFLADPSSYTALLPGGAESPFATFALVHYVGLSHLAGGLLLMVGMLTRLAALVQIPVLAGAAFLVHLPATGPFGQAFALAGFVLALLVVFAVWGGGPWSLDQAASRWAVTRETEESRQAAAVVREVRARPRLQPAPTRPAAPELDGAAEPACTCGHDRGDPHVRMEREYGGVSGLRFITGTHARPTAVTFRCDDCGGVVEVVEDPAELDRLRFARSG